VGVEQDKQWVGGVSARYQRDLGPYLEKMEQDLSEQTLGGSVVEIFSEEARYAHYGVKS
jgi:hypothetical protein